MQEDKFIDEATLAEISQIYVPEPVREHPGYRVYYDKDTLEIICFSQEDLPHPYVQTTQQIYESYRPDLYKIMDGKIVPRQIYFQNRLQIKANGVTFATVKGNQQLAVDKDWPGDKSYWDRND